MDKRDVGQKPSFTRIRDRLCTGYARYRDYDGVLCVVGFVDGELVDSSTFYALLVSEPLVSQSIRHSLRSSEIMRERNCEWLGGTYPAKLS